MAILRPDFWIGKMNNIMCPSCQSKYLMIKERQGFERIVIALTGRRKYNCCDCGLVFRMRDRRRFERESHALALAIASAGASNSPPAL
jgi:DNA-directed RNA polymerase subunit RPC12/RpoP